MADSLPLPGHRPAPSLLPEGGPDAAVAELLAEGVSATDAAAEHPSSSLAWAVLAEQAFADGETIACYAYARVGYHRGLDALRRSGWRGAGPVPWSHGPNQGFLRALAALGLAARTIDERDEALRIDQFVLECDDAAAAEIRDTEGRAAAGRTGRTER